MICTAVAVTGINPSTTLKLEFYIAKKEHRLILQRTGTQELHDHAVIVSGRWTPGLAGTKVLFYLSAYSIYEQIQGRGVRFLGTEEFKVTLQCITSFVARHRGAFHSQEHRGSSFATSNLFFIYHAPSVT